MLDVAKESIQPKEELSAAKVKEYIEKGAPKFLAHLSHYSLDRMNGLGWEEIGNNDEFGGTQKFAFGPGTTVPEGAAFNTAIQAGKIKFTGKRLCQYATYVAGEAMRRNFPEVKLSWVTLNTDMTERHMESPLFPEKHHLLQFQVREETAVVTDLTYGQVRNQQQVLFVSPENLEEVYPDPKRLAGEIEIIPFETKEKEFLIEKPLSYLTNDELEEMIKDFN